MADYLELAYRALKRKSTEDRPGTMRAGECLGSVKGDIAIARPACRASGEAAEVELVDYVDTLLSATPAAEGIKNRRFAAEYLTHGIVSKYGNPEDVAWAQGIPLRARTRSSSPWTARCPAGHVTDEALETMQVIGWVCERCRKVYDARECELVPRSGQTEEGR